MNLKINRKSVTQYLNNIQAIISQSKKLNDDILKIQNRQGAYFSGTPFEYNYICKQILKSSLTFEILEVLFLKTSLPLFLSVEIISLPIPVFA